jgi:hypothetical protein
MPTYTMTHILITQHIHEVDAEDEDTARALFETNQSWCVDTKESHLETDVVLVTPHPTHDQPDN